MARGDSYQSYRPANSDTRRELTAAGRLDPSAWRASAQALDEFYTQMNQFTNAEIDRAVDDAVRDHRFGAQAVSSQRLHIQFYFAICRLMWKRKLAELPWSQRELDRLLQEFKYEPSLRDIKVDFSAVMHKLIRNGAFDHIIGLTNSIVSIQYLPGVRRLMDRKYNEPMPQVRQTERPRTPGRTNGVPTSPRGERSTLDPINTAQQGPVQSIQNNGKLPVTPVIAARVPTPPAKQQKAPAEPQPVAATAKVDTAPAATAPIAHPEPKPFPSVGSSTSKAIVQEGLELLSKTNMMPFVHQYELLNDVLRLLERACFFWAEKTVPDVLKAKEWNAWQKVELLDWLDYFSAPTTPLNISPNTRSALVDRIVPGLTQMRNDAIRRKELPTAVVAQMMKYAKTLMVILKDEACLEILSDIANRLNEIELSSKEKRETLKEELKAAADAITKEFMKKLEDEIKAESKRTGHKLKQHLESCDWNFKFEAPTDEHYTRKGIREAASHKAPDISAHAAPVERAKPGPSGHARSASSLSGAIPDNHNERQASEPESTAASTSNGQGPPPRGTVEYEAFWTAFRNSSNNLPPVALVKEALDIDGRTWEDLRQVATAVIEENDLIELRWKDIQANHPTLILNFKGLHLQIFKELKSSAFMDLLCELTFHSARRGILERGRRKQSRQKAKEDEPVVASPNDPRIKNREARLARNQEETTDPIGSRDVETRNREERLAELQARSDRLHALKMTTSVTGQEDMTDPMVSRDAAARNREERLANLQAQSDRLHALKASTSTANRQPASEHSRSSRPRAEDYLEQDLSTRYSPNKRSISPADDRQDAQKRVKIEPPSQEDLDSIALEAGPGRDRERN